MDKIKTKVGHLIIKLNQEELSIFGREVSVCDSCNSILPDEGYYVSVMNRVYCSRCYFEWEKDAVYYDEDKVYEKDKFDYLLVMLQSI